MAYPHPTGLAFDISNNNGASFSVSLASAHHPDLHVVQVKIGEGRTFHDPDFARFFTAATKAGKVCQPYYFARPESEPGYAGGVAEARRMLSEYAPFASVAGAGIPCLDYESVRDPAFAAGFVSVVAGFLKRGLPIVYCSASRVPELRGALGRPVHFWIADYDVAGLPALGVSIAMWQFTDRAEAYPGVHCDASHLYVSPADLMLRGKQPLVWLEATSGGKRFARIRYGGGRVKAFLRSPGLVRRIRSGAVTLKRVVAKGNA